MCAAFFLLYYPNKYRDEIARACEEFSVEEDLVRGVIHTESKFRPSAVSAAGAVGLMQLMPDTAAWIAARLGYERTPDLTDPAENIRLGTAYLQYLLNKFPLTDALAAYNAGEGNVLRWQREGREEYPFPETRAYVRRVKCARAVYEKKSAVARFFSSARSY